MELRRRSFLGLSAAVLASPMLRGIDAHAQEATPSAAAGEAFTIYLLTIRGTLAPTSLDGARTLHNQTAGAPESIAAARALGDVSHMVYSPVPPAASGAGEVLFLDFWTSAEGLNQFFANPQVQEQAGQLFAERDPVVWIPADGFITYHLPAPYGENERFVVMVRGTFAARDEARQLHNTIVAEHINEARLTGDLSHDAYFRLSAPSEPESLEYLAIDVFKNAEGIQEFFSNPAVQTALSGLFAAPPTVTIWTNAPGDWVEW